MLEYVTGDDMLDIMDVIILGSSSLEQEVHSKEFLSPFEYNLFFRTGTQH